MRNLSPLAANAPSIELTSLPGRAASDSDLEFLADVARGQLLSATNVELQREALELMLGALRLRTPQRIAQLEAERLARCGVRQAS